MPVDLKNCLENYISGNIRQSGITATWFAIQLLCNQFEVGGCGAFVLRVLLHGDEEFHPEIRAPVGQ